jgi:hypothetical protein
MKNLTERYLDAADHFRTVFVRRGRTPDAAAAADEITRDIYADRIIPGSRLAGVSFFTYDGGPDGDDLTPGAGVILPDGRFLFTEPFGYLIPSPSVVAAAAAYFTHDRPAGPDPALYTFTVPTGPGYSFTFRGFIGPTTPPVRGVRARAR